MAEPSDAIRPFHVEAYPRLDLRHARRQVREGRDVVLWHDQAGVLAGMARLAIGPGDHMLVDARFRGLPYLTHGAFQDEIACEIVVRDEGHEDVMTRCRSCHERRRTIISNGGKWLCRYCQHLGYRSTIISPSIRMAERLSEIDALLWQGRPRYMTKRRFSELVDEGKDLRYLLEGRRTVVPPHQRHVLSVSWIEQPAPLLGIDGEPHVAVIEPEPSVSDLLEVTGSSLFSSASLAQAVENAISAEIGPAYQRLMAKSSRVTALQLRRAFKGLEVGEVPALGDMGSVMVQEGGGAVLEASVSVSFEGDARLFSPALRGPATERRPRGRVHDQHLLLSARFSPANAPFVPAMLQAEFSLVQRNLERQRAAMAEVFAGLPGTIKRLVAKRWLTLGTEGTN